MTWENSIFPDADNPLTVEYMIMYWRIVHCDSGCKDNYRLESRQFDHITRNVGESDADLRTRALALLEFYKTQKKATGKDKSIKRLTLFLTKVVNVERISDRHGDVV